MPESTPAERSLRERLREEIEKYLAISAYLYVCFGAIALYKWAVLRDVDLTFAPFGLALVKALIVGKFLLLGSAAGAGTRSGASGFVARVAVRTLGLLAVLVVLTIVEELLVGKFHGETAAAVVAKFLTHWPETAAMLLVVALILLPVVMASEFARARGADLLQVLRREVRGA